MDLEQCIDMHRQWKVRLRRFVDGNGPALNPATVKRDDRCDLGRWIHRPDSAPITNPDFLRIRAEHAAFHRAAADVVRASIEGQISDGEAQLAPGGKFTNSLRSLM